MVSESLRDTRSAVVTSVVTALSRPAVRSARKEIPSAPMVSPLADGHGDARGAKGVLLDIGDGGAVEGGVEAPQQFGTVGDGARSEIVQRWRER